MALLSQSKLEEAVAHCREAIRLQWQFAEAHNNLGNALARLDKLEEAAICYREALQINPNVADAHNGLGSILERQDKLDEAIHCFHEALRLLPDLAEARNNLGNALARQNKIDEGIICYHEALQLKPDFPEAHTNLGSAYVCQNKLEEGLRCFNKALKLDFEFLSARWNCTLLSLLKGDFEQAWPEYERRWELPGTPRRDFSEPLWDGSALDGRTILLYAEQGLGDTLQFIRYVPLVKQSGGTVVVECQPALVRLLSTMPGIDRLIAYGSPLPDFDVRAPLLSLPGIIHTTLANVPANVPYLTAEFALVEHWRQELAMECSPHAPREDGRHAERDDHTVGIAWQGSATYRYDRQRSIPLAFFSKLAEVPGIQLISLQKGPGAEQLAALGERLRIVDLGRQLDDKSGAFMDTAAVMKNLDLVITSDTVVAHLAGALGVPVWVALAITPDWRWLLERDDSPWYPTMKLFRQTRFGDWAAVFERMAAELRTRIQDQ